MELAVVQYWTCGRLDAYNSGLRWTKSPVTLDCSHPVFSTTVKTSHSTFFPYALPTLLVFSSSAVFLFYRRFWSLLRNIALNSISGQLAYESNCSEYVSLMRIKEISTLIRIYITNITTALLKNVFHGRMVCKTS